MPSGQAEFPFARGGRGRGDDIRENEKGRGMKTGTGLDDADSTVRYSRAFLEPEVGAIYRGRSPFWGRCDLFAVGEGGGRIRNAAGDDQHE